MTVYYIESPISIFGCRSEIRDFCYCPHVTWTSVTVYLGLSLAPLAATLGSCCSDFDESWKSISSKSENTNRE